MEQMELRSLTAEDVPSMARLARVDNRNVHDDEFERFLRLEGALALGVTRDGRLEGMVTLMRFYEHGWLGPLVTSGGADSVGISVTLAQHALERLRRSGVEYVEAEASAPDARVLEGIGFERVRTTLVLERAPSEREPTQATHALGLEHALDLGVLDAAAAGFGRKEYLLSLASAYPEGARGVSAGGALRGFALLRHARRGFALGPLVTAGEDAEAARVLLEDAVGRASTSPIVALAPSGSALLPHLAHVGFETVGELQRMRIGGAGEPDEDHPEPATEWLLGGRMTG